MFASAPTKSPEGSASAEKPAASAPSARRTTRSPGRRITPAAASRRTTPTTTLAVGRSPPTAPISRLRPSNLTYVAMFGLKPPDSPTLSLRIGRAFLCGRIAILSARCIWNSIAMPGWCGAGANCTASRAANDQLPSAICKHAWPDIDPG